MFPTMKLYRMVGKPFKGMIHDVMKRGPYYLSDWRDAVTYRVIPATLITFFQSLLPELAFALDLIQKTGSQGVSDVLLSSVIAAGIFSIFSCQPLCVVSVTGPITVYNYTVYKLLPSRENGGPEYLPFLAWTAIWAAIFHVLLAVFNAVSAFRHTTRFVGEVFAFYNAWIYLQYGVQVTVYQYEHNTLPAALIATVIGLLVVGSGWISWFMSQSKLFHRHIRRLFVDYGPIIIIIAASALPYWGRFRDAPVSKLPTEHHRPFEPFIERDWVVPFWSVEAKWVGIALPFGIILTILFYFDHNVSSLMCLSADYPVKKPGGFHWDFFLLGLCTFVTGILGCPVPNGLIPQAPIHTESLIVYKRIREGDSLIKSSEEKDAFMQAVQQTENLGNQHSVIETNAPLVESEPPEISTDEDGRPYIEVPVSVVEQRFSNLMQGVLSLICMTKPFLVIIGLIPRGVLAGILWFMGSQTLFLGTKLTAKLYYIMSDDKLVSPTEPLRKVRLSRVYLYVIIELVAFAAIFAITQTIAAVGFPIILILLIPIRSFIIPLFPFTKEELDILDGPIAQPSILQTMQVK